MPMMPRVDDYTMGRSIVGCAARSASSGGKRKCTFSSMPAKVSSCTAKCCSSLRIRSWTSSSGADAPAVMPSVRMPSSQPSSSVSARPPPGSARLAGPARAPPSSSRQSTSSQLRADNTGSVGTSAATADGVDEGEQTPRTAVPPRSARPARLRPARKPPVGPDEVAGVAVRVAFQVVLMLRLGLPEVAGRGYLGHHLARPESRRFDIGDRVLRDPLLLLARVEDGGAIAASDVVALTVQRGRIADLEEKLQKPPKSDGLGIKDDLDRLGMRSVIAVGRVRYVAARIADPRRDHARVAAEQ